MFGDLLLELSLISHQPIGILELPERQEYLAHPGIQGLTGGAFLHPTRIEPSLHALEMIFAFSSDLPLDFEGIIE